MKPIPPGISRIAFSVLFLFFIHASNAQRLSAMIGGNSSSLNHKVSGAKQDATGTLHFQAGLGVFVPFKPKDFKSSEEGNGIFPTLSFVGKGASKTTAIGPKADVRLSYLQLNVPLSFVGGSYGVGFGPYLAYALSGSKKYSIGGTGKQALDFTNDLKRTDLGLSFDITISLFRFQYDLGLSNIGVGTNTVKTRTLSLSLEIPLVD